MKNFKEFAELLSDRIDFKELKHIINLLSIEEVDIKVTPVFVNKLKNNFAESLTVMHDTRGVGLEFYNLKDNVGFLNFLTNKMKYKSTIDQTSRDNIFLTSYESNDYKGISKIELISREEIVPNDIDMTQVEAIDVFVNLK